MQICWESWSQDDAQKDLDEALPALDAAVRCQDAKSSSAFEEHFLISMIL